MVDFCDESNEPTQKEQEAAECEDYQSENKKKEGKRKEKQNSSKGRVAGKVRLSRDGSDRTAWPAGGWTRVNKDASTQNRN